jgi:2-methylcitrate dehydratase PrpD
VEPYSQAIGRFIRGLSIDDIPQAVVDKAKLVLLDTIGVALASSTMQFGAMVTRVAQALRGSPNSRLIGCDSKVAAANAVLAMEHWRMAWITMTPWKKPSCTPVAAPG